jgi:uncharacterized protein with HEPN domain
MKHPGRVRDYLEHIADAIERATRYAKNAGTLEALERDEQAQDAIVRTIAVIGEAAAKIQKDAPEFVAAHPELPWKQMRDIRNIDVGQIRKLEGRAGLPSQSRVRHPLWQKVLSAAAAERPIRLPTAGTA